MDLADRRAPARGTIASLYLSSLNADIIDNCVVLGDTGYILRTGALILVMEDDAMVEQGSHDELIAHGGAYAALYNAQFSGPDVVQASAEPASARAHSTAAAFGS